MFVTLEEAFASLTLADVWELAPNPNGTPCPMRDGVVKSPFRLDKKGASFSVSKGLKVFKDHADEAQKGGVWNFVALCFPEWSKQQLARKLIELAGGDPDQKDPNAQRKSAQEWKAEKEKAIEKARTDWVRAQLGLDEIAGELLLPAPKPVARGYELALERAADNNWQEDLATERGWPIEWVAGLVSLGRMGAGRKLQPEFSVEKYCHKLGAWSLCGVHSRWCDDDGRKMWSYRPNIKWDKQATVALPFVLGSVKAPVWVITEGQWDAATIFGMIGGYSDYPELQAAVFGIRGASGVGVFMSHYAPLLRRIKPVIVLIPDADDAAKGWTEDRRAHAGALPVWSFAHKLREIFKIEVRWMKCTAHKDINDWWAAGTLAADSFTEALASVSKAK